MKTGFTSWLARAMGDGTDPSSSRVVALPSLLINNILPWLVWGAVCFVKEDMVAFPPSVMAAMATINGALLVFMNAQKKIEATAKTEA